MDPATTRLDAPRSDEHPGSPDGPDAAFWRWRRVLQTGPCDTGVLEWIRELHAARVALMHAYHIHADGLMGAHREDARVTLAVVREPNQWAVRRLDLARDVIGVDVVAGRDEALLIFFDEVAHDAAPVVMPKAGVIAPR